MVENGFALCNVWRILFGWFWGDIVCMKKRFWGRGVVVGDDGDRTARSVSYERVQFRGVGWVGRGEGGG